MLSKKSRSRTRAALTRKHASRRRLTCERLERRIVLTAYIVNTIDDTNAADGMVSLREAITAANTNLSFVDASAGQSGPGQVDTIRFAPELSGQIINISSLGALQISDALEIADGNGQPLVIDGNARQIFNIASDTSLTISDLTLRNGSASQGGAIYVGVAAEVDLARVTLQNNRADDGGAIYNAGGLLNILDSNLSDNVADAASGSGGALFSASGTVSIVSSQLSFNSATRAGGGIEIVDGTMTMLRSSLVRNDVNGIAGTANPGNGGALHVSGTAIITISNGIVTGNTAASEGGGLWNQAGSILNVHDSLIFRNSAFGNEASNGGGGVFNNGGVVNITGAGTTISNNSALGTAGSGGGIFNDLAGTVNITDATVTGNVANRAGGGIEAVAGTTTNLTNVILSTNNVGVGPDAVAAPGNGGGLHITGAGNATIIGGEVSGNVAAQEGGGLWNGAGTMTISGTLIVGNSASGAAAHDGGGGIFNNGGPLNISGATISDNLSDGTAGSGGGLFSLAGAVTVAGTTFNLNSANRAGGGIEIVDGTLTLTDSNLISNDVSGGAGVAAPGNGGGLHVSGGSTLVTIDGGSVFGNLAASEGGGLWNQAGSTLTVQNGTLIVSNAAFGNDSSNGGGGIFNNGGTVNVTGVNTTLSENFASGTSGSGGGIFNDAAGILNITDATIRGNVANRAGGGIEAVAGTTTNLANVILSMNSAGIGPDAVANPGNGGGFHITGNGNATISGGEVNGNLAALEGGGLWNGSGTMTIDGTMINGNIARGDAAHDGGGGVFNNGGTLLISGASISANAADGLSGSGGGVFNLGGVATIANSSITGNVANRAGGGIESTAGSTTTLNDVALDGNNAGVAITGEAASLPLLAYQFDESGTSALATGSTATVDGAPLLLFMDNSGNPADLRGPAGSGVSGQLDDFAFDNTNSSGTTNASHAQHATDFDGIDALSAFTLSGWFMLPATATESIGRQDALIENGTISVLDEPGGFRLRGGAAANAGTLELRVNRDAAIESPAVYTEIGTYVYFAVSYDGTQTSDNVKFYKGTPTGGVTLVDTLTLNAGLVNQENIPLSIGVTQTSGLTLNPFNGLLDEIRIDGTVVSISELESRRFAATRLDVAIAANPGNGGGLHISGDAIVRINDGSVSGNFAAAEGGGLWNSTTGNLIVDGTVIAGNSAMDGGGVYSDGGNTVLTGVSVTNNTAAESGGGIKSQASGSAFQNLTIEDSLIDSNAAGAAAAGTGGGGIYAAGFSVLTNTDITNNTAIEGTADGGGVLAAAGSDFSLQGGMLSGNRAARAGGGVENLGFFSSFSTSFDNNSAGVNGGALHQSGFATSVLFDAEVTNNSAANEGGGLWTSAGGFLSVADSTFDNNEAMFGGAIFADGVSSDTSVDRSVFTNNTAAINGGAIATEGGSLFLADNSFIGNSAGGNAPGLGGGAIFTASDNDISNNDLIDNSAASPMGNGGGILVAEGGTGIYFGGLVQGNMAGRAGGGFEVIGQLTIDLGFDFGSEIPLILDGNTAGINGGALHITGTGAVTIRRASVTNNSAAAEGGGLWNSASGTLSVDRVTITGNVASGDAADQGGGGIFSDGGSVEVVDSVLSDNLADGISGSGGGILSNAAMLTVTDTMITGNIAVRAGGGIETVGAAVTTLTNVNLDENSAGLDLSLAGANVPLPLLSYNFNETGTFALATGSAADGSGNPVLNFNANDSTAAADLHSAAGTGVSGQPDDRAFDNTGAGNQFSNVSHGQHAADFDPIDTLDAFTLSGWFRLPSDSQSIGLQDSLFENGSTNAGFRLRGGNSTSAGTLQLTVDGQTRESSQAYTEVGEFVYFAVSYDGTSSTDNVRFYKGTVDDGLTLVDTFSINAGAVDTETLPLFIGANRQFLAQFPFNGLLDNIRIDGTALSMESLEFLRADAVGQATGFRANPGNGGGLHISGPGEVTITAGTANHNFAASEGGGLWNSSSGTLTVTGTAIQGNIASGTASDNGGGGIFNDGGIVNISGAVISGNLANGAAGSGGGLLTVAGSVSITGTTLSSNSANRAGGGIEIVDGTLSLLNSDLISNDVNGGAGAASPGNGGGLHTSGNAAVNVEGGAYVGNEAASEGGAFWIQGTSSLTTSSNATFVNNAAHGAAADDGGGALFNNGGSIILNDTSMFANRADGASGSGGAIFNLGGTILGTNLFVGSNFANRAGGGIEDSGGTMQLVMSTLSNNSALSAPGNGGALHITGASVVGLEEVVVSQNVATAEGGGLWNSSTGTLNLVRSTVDRNIAGAGGGIFNDGTGGAISLDSSTVSRNRATGNGGGILSEGGTVSILNSTISSNNALNGAGVRMLDGSIDLTSTTIAFNIANLVGGGVDIVAGNLSAINSLIARNDAPAGPDINGTLNSGGFNLIGNTDGATIVGTANGVQTNVNPMLGVLQNNGGPTETHALLASSPALDSGAASVAPIDQRAVVRPQGSAFDIGAYEASVALLANAMALRTDVSGDGLVTPLDALLVINRINQSGEGESMPSLREDVNGDGQVSPLDVLLVVNQLNSGATELTTRSTETETNQSVDLSMAQADVAQWLDDIRKKDAGWGLNSGDEELLLASLASHRLRSLTGD